MSTVDAIRATISQAQKTVTNRINLTNDEWQRTKDLAHRLANPSDLQIRQGFSEAIAAAPSIKMTLKMLGTPEIKPPAPRILSNPQTEKIFLKLCQEAGIV